MNTIIKHLYTELPIANKKQVYLDFQQSPKMLLYLDLLEGSQKISTQKAVATIYKEERELVDDKVLINRFYKLRSKLHLYLLNQIKDHPNSLTKEEKELAFLRLLVLKNEHQDAMKKLKVLEQKCWDDNLFELLPEVFRLIKSAMHAYQPSNREILDYIKKADLAAELLYNLQWFQNQITGFSANYYTVNDDKSLQDYYKSTMNKMRRKSKVFKDFPRFTLIYHYTAFCIGCQLGAVTAAISNILSRHLNKLRELLEQYPNMPMNIYVPHHRLANLDFTYLQEAMYWYNRQKPKKSFACILQSRQIRMENPNVYFKTMEGTLNNIVLCCMYAKEAEVALEYIEMIKEFQISNNAVEEDIPYFIYEAANYVSGYPTIKHSEPDRLIKLCQRFLPKIGEELTWMYETVASFCLLYGFLEECEELLTSRAIVKDQMIKEVKVSLLDLLKLVKAKDYQGIRALIHSINQLIKENKAVAEVHYLNSLKEIANHF